MSLVSFLIVYLLILINWLVHLLLRNEVPVANEMVALPFVCALVCVTLFVAAVTGGRQWLQHQVLSLSLFRSLYLLRRSSRYFVSHVIDCVRHCMFQPHTHTHTHTPHTQTHTHTHHTHKHTQTQTHTQKHKHTHTHTHTHNTHTRQNLSEQVISLSRRALAQYFSGISRSAITIFCQASVVEISRHFIGVSS